MCQACVPCGSPTWLAGFGFPVLAIAELDKALWSIFTGYKDHNLVALRPYLSSLLRDNLSELGEIKFESVMIPPRNKANFIRRGFDPTRDIARHGFPRHYPVTGMSLGRVVLDQRSLDRQGRLTNVANSFKVPGQIRGPVLLFDDVLTTGATIRELHRAAIAAGVQVAGACVIAERK